MTNPLYTSVGNPVTRAIEECAELQQALCKAERCGWFSHHPDRPGKTNMDEVKAEMDDVVEAIEKLQVVMRLVSHSHNAATNEVPA